MHPFFDSPFAQHSDSNTPFVHVFSLSALCVFEATGEDTLTFLQGQLTNDIVAPGVGESRLAGYCTAQGRLLATMVLGQCPNLENKPTLLGFMRKDISAAVLKRLSMFVLRAKVTFRTADLSVAGVCASPGIQQTMEAALGHLLPTAPWQTIHAASGIWVAAPGGLSASSASSAPSASSEKSDPRAPLVDEPLQRWWWIAGPMHQQMIEKLPLNWAVGDTALWNCQDIEAGLPWIEARTQDLFIPQTLNLELIGGVSFTKGCYPGQEIVARSHYRGTVKKRMTLGRVVTQKDVILHPGSDIFDATQPDQPCGRLINVSVSTVAQECVHSVLFETSFEAVDRQQLRAVSASGPAIQIVPLPYATR